jgi:dethiobiotin synthetase
MKPAESGCVKEDGAFIASDGEFLLEMAGSSDPLKSIVPYQFKEPLAPAVAAQMEGVRIDVSAVVETFEALAKQHEFMIVEGAGGLLVPFSTSFLVIDLIKLLALPVLIVGRVGLGTINHTLLTVQCAQAANLTIRGIVLNSIAAEEETLATQTNPDVIASLTDVPIIGVIPYVDDIGPNAASKNAIMNTIRKHVNWEILV